MTTDDTSIPHEPANARHMPEASRQSSVLNYYIFGSSTFLPSEHPSICAPKAKEGVPPKVNRNGK